MPPYRLTDDKPRQGASDHLASARGWFRDSFEQGKAAGSGYIWGYSEATEASLVREVTKKSWLVTTLGPTVYSSLWLAQDFVKDFVLWILPDAQTAQEWVARARLNCQVSTWLSATRSGKSKEWLFKKFVNALIEPYLASLHTIYSLPRSGSTIRAHLPTCFLSISLAAQAPLRALLRVSGNIYDGSSMLWSGSDANGSTWLPRMCNPVPGALMAVGLWCSFHAAALDSGWRRRMRKRKYQIQQQNLAQSSQKSPVEAPTGQPGSAPHTPPPRGSLAESASALTASPDSGVSSARSSSQIDEMPVRPHGWIVLHSAAAFTMWVKGATWLLGGLMGADGDDGVVQALLTERAAAAAVSAAAATDGIAWESLWHHGPTISFNLGIVAYIFLWRPHHASSDGEDSRTYTLGNAPGVDLAPELVLKQEEEEFSQVNSPNRRDDSQHWNIVRQLANIANVATTILATKDLHHHQEDFGPESPRSPRMQSTIDTDSIGKLVLRDEDQKVQEYSSERDGEIKNNVLTVVNESVHKSESTENLEDPPSY